MRIEKLLASIGDDKAVFISSYPNIFYYSGFSTEDGFLLISKDKRILITDSRYTVQAKEQAPEFEVVDISEGFKSIFARISEKIIGFEEQSLTYAEYERYNAALSDGQVFEKMQEKINAPRRIKDDCEIKRIAEAERLGDEAFSYVLDKIKPGMTENEVALMIEFFMKKNGASGLSFDTIAASGRRGAMPHGRASDKIIEKGDLLTLDFGCVYEGYCSDMTRTIAIGSVEQWQQDMYNLVLKAQTEALKAITAGKKCSEVDAVARSIIADAGFGKNFGHGLGHSVGIEIHEEPRLSPKCYDIIQNGNLLTVEPGVYVENMGGVRIEDLVAVVDGKPLNLTRSEKSLIIL